MKMIGIMIVMMILLAVPIFAFTVELDQSEYSPLEVVTAVLSCNTGNEKNQPYNVTWTNGTDVFEIDSGITPSNCPSAIFFEDITIPSGSVWNNAKVNITGTNLEGEAFFNVTSSAEGSIRIVNIEFSSNPRIGKIAGVKWEVIDSIDSLISNAECDVHIEDEKGFHLRGASSLIRSIRTYDTMGVLGVPLSIKSVKEDTQYVIEIHCMCGSNATTNTCFTKNGDTLQFASSTSEASFSIGRWANVNTIVDKTSYTLADEQIKVCANITNNDTTQARSYDIQYDLRCDGSSNQSVNNVLLDEYEEERAVESGSTQTNCALLDLNNIKTVQNKESVCYARTHVKVLDDDHQSFLIEYDTRSPNFNFTSNSNTFVEEKDTMASLSITIFSLILPLILFLLFMKRDLVPTADPKKEWINMLARRSCLTVAVYLMILNAAIIATIADAGDIPVLNEMFMYITIYGWFGYIMIIIIVIKTMMDLIENWKRQASNERFGE